VGKGRWLANAKFSHVRVESSPIFLKIRWDSTRPWLEQGSFASMKAFLALSRSQRRTYMSRYYSLTAYDINFPIWESQSHLIQQPKLVIWGSTHWQPELACHFTFYRSGFKWLYLHVLSTFMTWNSFPPISSVSPSSPCKAGWSRRVETSYLADIGEGI